ncbi:MAG TPA: dihydrodipicolinate synthase family protein, partial [Humisphaera sp.]|nr:dihydrodipicolinate synthase family protein [Humisphaera sp.]
HATSGIVPELTRQIFDFTTSGNLAAAVPLQLRLIELFDAMLLSADFPEGFRAAVELRGFNFGRGRQPLSDVQQVDRVALQRVLGCILSDFGVIAGPEEGCVMRTGNMERDKVLQVTEAVLRELRQRGVQ